MPTSIYGDSGPEKISAAYDSDSTITRMSATSPAMTVGTMPSGASSLMNRSKNPGVGVRRKLPWQDCSAGHKPFNAFAVGGERADSPTAAVFERDRLRHFRLRRQHDPLGEGQPCTWRTLLIKVAAEVIVRTRRIVVRLSSNWPHLEWYRRVCERLRNPASTPVAEPSG